MLIKPLYLEQRKVYIRTEKEIEIQEKLIGLKNYITDFSGLKERNINELIHWDYYMIYAIIFDLKGNLNDEVKELYNMIDKK